MDVKIRAMRFPVAPNVIIFRIGLQQFCQLPNNVSALQNVVLYSSVQYKCDSNVIGDLEIMQKCCPYEQFVVKKW